MHVSENDKVIIAPAFRISTMLLVKEGTITIEEAIARIKNAETEQVARPSSGLAITAPSNDYSGSVEGMVVPGASMLADTVPVPVADGVVGATPDGNGDGLVSPTTPSNTIVRSGSASSMQSTMSTARTGLASPNSKLPPNGTWFVKKSGTSYGADQRRYFVLEATSIIYYDNLGKKMGQIDLVQSQTVTGEGKVLVISSPGRVYHLTADSEVLVNEWVAKVAPLLTGLVASRFLFDFSIQY